MKRTKLLKIFIYCLVTAMIGVSKAPAQSTPKTTYENQQVDTLNVIQAKNTLHLDNYLTSFRKLRRLSTICDAQLSKGIIPVACYRLLNLEATLKILDKERWTQAMKSLESFCVNSTETLQEDLLVDLTVAKKIGPRCLKHLRERIEITNYKKGTQGAVQNFHNRKIVRHAP